MQIIQLPVQQIERFNAIIEQLFVNDFYDAISYHKSKFGDYYVCNPWDWYASHKEVLQQLDVTMCAGCTKVCIIDNHNHDWVIKIGILEASDPDKKKFGVKVEDYCDRELKIYEQAIEDDLEEYFAAMLFFGTFHGVNVYLQQYAEVDSDVFYDLCGSYCERAYNMSRKTDENGEYCESLSSYRYRISDAAEDVCDEERVEAVFGSCQDTFDLISFLYKNDINDLHDENWGKLTDDRWVLIDYSGYFG